MSDCWCKFLQLWSGAWMASLWIEWINPVHHLSIYCISSSFTSLLDGQGQDIKVPDGRLSSTAHCTGLALLSTLSNEVPWQRIACTAVRLHLTESHRSHIASLATLCTIYFTLYMLSYHNNNNILITLQCTGHWSYPGLPWQCICKWRLICWLQLNLSQLGLL